MKTVFKNDLVEIIHGDCLHVMDQRFISQDDNRVDLVFGDPPFNIGQDYGDAVDDNMDDESFRDWLFEVSDECFESLACVPRGLCGVLWFHGPDELATLWLEWSAKNDIDRIAWVQLYYGFGQARSTNWIDSRCHGLAFAWDRKRITWNPGAVKIETARRKQNDKRVRDRDDVGFRVPGTIWGIEAIDGPFWGRVQGNNAERVPGRPNQLPEKYLERIIRAYTNPGDLVFDPFCGTGTTAVVAAALGRRCVTCDLSLEACELAAKRVQRGAVRIKPERS